MSIDNTEDVIDSCDIIERIAALENEVEQLIADIGGNTAPDDFVSEREDLSAAQEELRNLQALAEQADYISDWQYGETLIRDSYFEDYARELAEDIGAIPEDAGWPLYCIDWERAARELRMDYSSLDFDGVTYWARS